MLYQIELSLPNSVELLSELNILYGAQDIWICTMLFHKLFRSEKRKLSTKNIYCNEYLLFVIQISIAYVNALRGKAC